MYVVLSLWSLHLKYDNKFTVEMVPSIFISRNVRTFCDILNHHVIKCNANSVDVMVLLRGSLVESRMVNVSVIGILVSSLLMLCCMSTIK